jgi:transcriptional regulator with XRE-family HTH domain
MSATILGQHLKQSREALGMSVQEVSKIAEHVSEKYIEELEAGRVKFPSPHALYALSGIYFISYIKLMEMAGHLRPNPLKGELRA